MDPRIYASTLWLMEEGILIRKEGKKTLRKTATGWPQVSNIKGRKHTVFAGHIHHYAKYQRNGTSFYTRDNWRWE